MGKVYHLFKLMKTISQSWGYKALESLDFNPIGIKTGCFSAITDSLLALH